MATQNRNGISPWVYVGCGCAAIVVLGFVLVIAAGYLGFTKFQGYVEDMKDPQVREARALRILGAEQLPEGYHAQMFFSIPLLLDMVILSDGEPIGAEAWEDDSVRVEDLGDNTFFYVAVRDDGSERRELRRYLEGKSDKTNLDLDLDIDFRPREVLTRGAYDTESETVRYTVHRGEFVSGNEREPGFYTMAMFDCPRSSRLHLGVWFQRAAEDAAAELAPVEPELRRFLSPFRVCDG